MISIDFLNKVYKILDSQEYNLSFSPAKFKNYMLYCNGNFIGGLFDEELCFVYADSVSELLGQPEPVYRGYSSTAQHRMLVIPEEHWAKALKLLYTEKFDWSRLVYDITYTSIGAAVVEDFYDENVVFLRFCFDKELLKKNPLDHPALRCRRPGSAGQLPRHQRVLPAAGPARLRDGRVHECGDHPAVSYLLVHGPPAL